MRAYRLAGFLLFLGLGLALQSPGQTTEERQKEFAALKARAGKGDAEAQIDLAALYAAGQGVPKDLRKAAKLHRKAADQGSSRGQLLVALDYANGDGVKANKTEAVKWLQLAADQGLAEAQYDLGMCLSTGDGAPQSPVDAAKLFRKAAEQGYPEAKAEVGKCYLDGIGVLKDIPEGIKWTRQAAEEGAATAQNTLGLCYAKGRGVNKDMVEAYKWFNLASAQSDGVSLETKMNLAMAERALTPQQIAEGQRQAREFKPRNPAPTIESPPPALNPEVRPPGVGPKPSGAPGSAPPMLAPQKTGFVNVKAQDDSYEVFADGEFVGNSPARLKLAEGTHLLEVKKPGFKDFRKQIKVSEGADLNLRAVLEKQ